MVVIDAPSAITARTVQDFTACPSISTVQAPHCDVSQPTWVPVRPRSSRNRWTSSFSGFDRSALNDAIDVDGHDVMLFIGFNHLFLRLASRVTGCPLMRGGCRRYRSPRRSEVELRCRRLSCEEPAASLQP